MNRILRIISVVLVKNMAVQIACLCVLFSCAFTPALYKEKSNIYVEEISSLWVTEDEASIVVLTPKYHYVFEAPPLIMASLKSDFARKVNARFDRFHVGKNNGITGQVLLKVLQVTETEFQSARTLGYKGSTTDEIGAYVVVNGVRYLSNNDTPRTQPYYLNKKHEIEVSESSPILDSAVSAALTPIAIVGDGVLMLGGLVLTPIILPVISAIHEP